VIVHATPDQARTILGAMRWVASAAGDTTLALLTT